MISLKSKSVLITGCSGGLGAATAHAFAKEGANILVNCISDETSAANVAAEISRQVRSQGGDRAGRRWC